MKNFSSSVTSLLFLFIPLCASAEDDYYIPGRPITLGMTVDCETDEPCAGRLSMWYMGNLNLNTPPILEADPGIGPCVPTKLPLNRFEVACPFSTPGFTYPNLAVTFGTSPDGVNKHVRQDSSVIDENGTHIGAFAMPPRAKTSPNVKERYFLYNTSRPVPRKITVSNQGPSSSDRFEFFFFGTDSIMFPHNQPPGVTYYNDQFVTLKFDSRNNPAGYLRPGGQKIFTINVQPDGIHKQIPFVYPFTGQIHSYSLPQPEKFKFYLVNTTNIPSGAVVAAGIVIGAVEASHSSNGRSSNSRSSNNGRSANHQQDNLQSASFDPTDTSLTAYVIMGSPSYNRDISYDLIPISASANSANTTFQLSVSGKGTSISDIKHNEHYLTCTQAHSALVSCTLLPHVKIADLVPDVVTMTVKFTDSTDYLDTQVNVVKGSAHYAFGSQRISISAENDGLPNGSYRNSCKSIKWDDNSATLQAQCTNEKKQWITSAIDYFNACWQGGSDYGLLPPPGLSNTKGQLTCVAKNPIPGGSWVSNCKNPGYDGATLSASCMDADGANYRNTKINVGVACTANYKIPFPSGIPSVSNLNGKLACELPNFTPEMHSHCTFDNNWNGIDTLTAVCNGVTSSFSGDQYQKSCVYRTPLTVMPDNKIGCKFSIRSDNLIHG